MSGLPSPLTSRDGDILVIGTWAHKTRQRSPKVPSPLFRRTSTLLGAIVGRDDVRAVDPVNVSDRQGVDYSTRQSSRRGRRRSRRRGRSHRYGRTSRPRSPARTTP